MTLAEARKILMLYRPGTSDADDPEMVEALRLARENGELRAWFEQHRACQTVMRRKLREMDVPVELRDRLLAAGKTIRPTFRRRRASWLAAAAAVAVLLAVAALMMRPRVPDGFADYRSRMVRTVLREYRMDIATNDMSEVRRFLAAQGAPSDYVVPAGLAGLKLTGAGALRWRSNPVAMVCFDRGTNEMVFLFVMDRTAVRDSPPAIPQVARVNKLTTASWTRDGRTYVLAGQEEADFPRKYF